MDPRALGRQPASSDGPTKSAREGSARTGPCPRQVNISEAQKDAVLAAFNEGHLDRSIFHGAIMSVFPVLMYFWKR